MYTNDNINTPKLSFYHANAKGTGSVVHFELRPASGITNEPGAIFGCLAKQNPIGNLANGDPVTFDYKTPIFFSLDFTDICLMLQVFRGECDKIADGKGIYKRLANDCTQVITLEHTLIPRLGYALQVATFSKEFGRDVNNIVFNSAEALGIATVFENSLKEIAFGTGYEATSIAITKSLSHPCIEKENSGTPAKTDIKNS